MNTTKNKSIKDYTKKLLSAETTAATMLLIGTVIALAMANYEYDDYHHTLQMPFSLKIGELELNLSFHHLINDGLMGIFFLIVGIEIRKELLYGELNSIQKTTLPLIAAVGGVIVPALIYWVFSDAQTLNGWAIPTATDIAFAIGILALVGKAVPDSLRVFLLALAIFDDLIASIIIAIFYSNSIDLYSLFLVGVGGSILYFFQKQKITQSWVYLSIGALLWYFLYKSGIHSALVGIVVAFLLPINNNEESTTDRLEHLFQPIVNTIILPLFAFANAGIILSLESLEINNIVWGVGLGLLIGKPVGIVSSTYIAKALGYQLPGSFLSLLGLGIIAGIGFTMSIFVTDLSFNIEEQKNNAKFAILVAFVIASGSGYLLLKRATRATRK